MKAFPIGALLALALLTVTADAVGQALEPSGEPWIGVQISRLGVERCIIINGLFNPERPTMKIRVASFPPTSIRVQVIQVTPRDTTTIRSDRGHRVRLDWPANVLQGPYVVRVQRIDEKDCGVVFMTNALLIDYDRNRSCTETIEEAMGN